jgi:ABC-2 type transport system permease protein
VIRHSAGAITAVTGMVLLLPLALGQFPSPWNVRLERLMPYLSPIIARHPPLPGDFTPGIALLVSAAWAAAAITAGLLTITRKDA